MEKGRPVPIGDVGDGDWAVIDLRTEVTDRAANVANKLGMHFEEFMLIALEEKLVRMGLRHGPGRERAPLAGAVQAPDGVRKSSGSDASSSADSSGSESEAPGSSRPSQ